MKLEEYPGGTPDPPLWGSGKASSFNCALKEKLALTRWVGDVKSKGRKNNSEQGQRLGEEVNEGLPPGRWLSWVIELFNHFSVGHEVRIIYLLNQVVNQLSQNHLFLYPFEKSSLFYIKLFGYLNIFLGPVFFPILKFEYFTHLLKILQCLHIDIKNKIQA